MYLLIKRSLDIVLSLMAIIVLLPLFIPIMILLKLTGEHDIFYFQKRIGYKNKEFYIFKFATMLKNSPNMGTGAITVRNDPRLLPLGKFLRMTKINELPQLFNVLLGDMSIIGARPLMKKSFDLYPPDVQAVVYATRPGISGIGSIIFRDEEKIMSESKDLEKTYKEIFAYKGQLEKWYQQNKSLYVDFMIVFLTVWVILFSESRLPYKVFKGLPERQIG